MSAELPLNDPRSELELEIVHNEHNARYLRERNPRLYEAVKLLLECARPQVEIAARLQISENLVRAIEREEIGSVEEGKKRVLDSFRLFLVRGAQRLAENVDKLKLESLPIALAVIQDKVTLAEGGVTSRTEVVQSEAEREAAAFFEQARSGSGMVLEAEVLPAKAALPEMAFPPADDGVHLNTNPRKPD